MLHQPGRRHVPERVCQVNKGELDSVRVKNFNRLDLFVDPPRRDIPAMPFSVKNRLWLNSTSSAVKGRTVREGHILAQVENHP